MSEEEKKAIEGLKHAAENPESKFWIGTQGMENIQIVLNLIEKQQEEIKSLTAENDFLKFMYKGTTEYKAIESFIEENEKK